VAQSEPQQFVVGYVEFKPANARAGGDVLQQLEARAEDSAGVIRFDVLQQTDRPNFFALFEVWSNAQTFGDFQDSSETQAILAQLTPLLEAPLDQRPGNLLTGTVKSSQSAREGASDLCDHARGRRPQFVPKPNRCLIRSWPTA
jgi:quinol monooxygenase YgiN